MRLIIAIIRPEKLHDVLEALYHREVRGLTISRCQGHGGETSEVATYRGTRVKMELVEKIRLEIAVSQAFVDVTVDTIATVARTGDVGDGKIIVQPLDQTIRICTGEHDADAVTPAGPVVE